ncbi:LINE-1 type transposase domain-containing protein 1 [Dipodomys spectabilis]|uniref:LINE-1 type transposase domain-containing protein 1 n=1 Tax=Dipodomys spectabilis TaxID=105255 RepID=UPI001C548AA1|nr:LINE-1 type transposase domain-containing protein 1 [Dipodomys spectabilis]
MARLVKKQGKATYIHQKQLVGTDREISPVLDSKYKATSAAVRKKFKVLEEMRDLMIEDIRKSLKNDLREMLGNEVPDHKSSKNATSRTEYQVKALTSQKKELVEETEDENSESDDDTEDLTFQRKKANVLDRAKKYNREQGEKLSHHLKATECVEEVLCSKDKGHRNLSMYTEVTPGGNRKNEKDKVVKQLEEDKNLQKLGTKEKALMASEEEMLTQEGAVLTLAADFSSATLDISKQWARVFDILRENDFEPKLECRVELAFKCDGEIQRFSDLQTLRKFASQNLFVKGLLKDVLPQNQKGKREGIQEKMGKTDSKHEAGGTASDGLSFLFVKEVKVARSKVKNVGTQKSSQTSRLEQEEGEETSETEEEGEEISWTEEEEESSETEEEEASEIEEEEFGEETSGQEEREEASEMEEGEETEEASILREEQGSTFQSLSVVNTKLGTEKMARDGLEISLVDLVMDHQMEEEEEVGKVKTTSWPKKKENFYGLKEIAFSYLVWDAEKKKLVKCREPLEVSSGDTEQHSQTDLSAAPGILSFPRETREERHKTFQIERLASRDANLIQETEENFRRSVIGMCREVQEKVENINSGHPDVLEIKNSIDDLYNLFGLFETKIHNLEDEVEELSKNATQMAKHIISKERVRDREDRFRSSNIRLIGIPEKDTQENEAEDIIKEVIEENFPEMKDFGLEIVSANRVPSSVDERRPTPRHILVKLQNSNDKHRIIRASRERKEVTYRGTRIRLTADLSVGTLDARSQWTNIIKVLQEEGFEPRIRYPAKLVFDFEVYLATQPLLPNRITLHIGNAIKFSDLGQTCRHLSQLQAVCT